MRERGRERKREILTPIFKPYTFLYFALACCTERERESKKERDPYTNFQTLPGRQTTYFKDTIKSEHTY
jgi:hypothetical protein